MLEGKKLICPITGTSNFENLFSIKNFPIYMGVVNKNYKAEFKTLNFKIHKVSGCVQIHPKISLKKLYFKPHGSGTVGKTWKNHHNFFFNFISKDMRGLIFEIGGGHNSVSEEIKNFENLKSFKLMSFDPNGKKNNKPNHKIIKDFFSKKYASNWKNKVDLIIHSHLFEHIYDPNLFLKNIKDCLKDDGLHMFSVPNLKFMIKNGYANGMNFEHPYFLEEKLIDHLLKKNGFSILKKKKYLNHSIFYKTRKEKKILKKNYYSHYDVNKKLFNDFNLNLQNDVVKLNSKIKKINNEIYLFGAHIFSQILIFNKLDISKVIGILDNDKKKQKKYLYGTKIKVFDPIILKKKKSPIIILRAGQYSNEIKKQIIKKVNKNARFI